ncbi:Holliday junction branch migration protein RuvA [Mucisphaera sp.]|uniref:Holliday junction branch migration protein RuvA n=1 Tax=Mucisphaera sp. TaxID=2913024 RepID=UPI003D128DD2
MISRMTGILESVHPDRVTLQSGPMSLEILVPASEPEQLNPATGSEVTLHTLLIIESQNQGASLTPRLIGFSTATDRAFFELFVTCKGIGHRKALRAMALPAAVIATAIDTRDLATLQSLPEIGKRTAETIVATLSGKVDRFAVPDPDRPATPSAAKTPAIPEGPAAEAVELLVRLGEQRNAAEALVEKAMAAESDLQTSEQVLAAVYRVR